MGTARAQVIQELSSFAVSGRQTSDFSMHDNLKHLSAGDAKKVSEGYCMGVCLDWARRVLAGKPVFTANADKIARQTLRQSTIFKLTEIRNQNHLDANAVNTRLTYLYNAHVRAKLNSFKFSPDAVVQSHLRNIYMANVGSAPPSDASGPKLHADVKKYLPDLDPNVSKVFDMDTVDDWTAALSAKVDSYNHYTGAGWAALVDGMDKIHSRTLGTKTTKRPFTNIKTLAAEKERFYGNHSAENALQHLLQLHSFARNTVLILGFGLTVSGKHSTHGVAVYQQNTGTFLFLDANYGTFEYQDVSQLYSALCYLFDGSGGTPIYGEDGDSVTGAVSHLVLGRA